MKLLLFPATAAARAARAWVWRRRGYSGKTPELQEGGLLACSASDRKQQPGATLLAESYTGRVEIVWEPLLMLAVIVTFWVIRNRRFL